MDKLQKNFEYLRSELKIHLSHLWWLWKTSKLCLAHGMVADRVVVKQKLYFLSLSVTAVQQFIFTESKSGKWPLKRDSETETQTKTSLQYSNSVGFGGKYYRPWIINDRLCELLVLSDQLYSRRTYGCVVVVVFSERHIGDKWPLVGRTYVKFRSHKLS